MLAGPFGAERVQAAGSSPAVTAAPSNEPTLAVLEPAGVRSGHHRRRRRAGRPASAEQASTSA
jgi:hypothetical protein